MQFRNQLCLLARLAQQGYWSDLRADTGTLFFPDKNQTKHSHTQLHKEESLFFVKGMMVAPLTTAGVSDEVAQELQMPLVPQRLEDVGEPMPARRATLRDPGHSRSDRDGITQSDTLSESTLVQDVRRIPRTRFTTSRIVENRCRCTLNFSLIAGTWGMEALYR